MKANLFTAILYAICAVLAALSLVSPAFLVAFVAGMVRFKSIKVVTRPLYSVNMLISLFVGLLVWGYPEYTFSTNGVAHVLFAFYAVLCAIIGVFDAKLLHAKKPAWYAPPALIVVGAVSVFFVGAYGVSLIFAVQAVECLLVKNIKAQESNDNDTNKESKND